MSRVTTPDYTVPNKTSLGGGSPRPLLSHASLGACEPQSLILFEHQTQCPVVHNTKLRPGILVCCGRAYFQTSNQIATHSCVVTRRVKHSIRFRRFQFSESFQRKTPLLRPSIPTRPTVLHWYNAPLSPMASDQCHLPPLWGMQHTPSLGINNAASQPDGSTKQQSCCRAQSKVVVTLCSTVLLLPIHFAKYEMKLCTKPTEVEVVRQVLDQFVRHGTKCVSDIARHLHPM